MGIVAFLVLGAQACRSATTLRPRYAPFPTALFDTLTASPSELIDQVAISLAEEGVETRTVSLPDGYLETTWFNLESGRPGRAPLTRPDRSVRMRFWANPAGLRGSELVSEAVFQWSADPSLPSRLAERIVPPGHDGENLLERIIQRVKDRFGG